MIKSNNLIQCSNSQWCNSFIPLVYLIVVVYEFIASEIASTLAKTWYTTTYDPIFELMIVHPYVFVIAF